MHASPADDLPVRRPGWVYGVLAALMLYCFIAAIKLMGHGLGDDGIAGDPVAKAQMSFLFGFTENPFVGLCVGVLLTSMFQSSSFTTSLTVTLVANGELQLTHAIPLVMGANIGTSVTNLLVSLGHIRRPLEFRRALAGAAVHDFFNVCSVLLFFPLELAFGILSRPAQALAGWLGELSFFRFDPEKFNIIESATSPITALVDLIVKDVFGLSLAWAGGVTAAVAILMLFVSLFFLVKVLRELMMHRVGSMFENVLFARPWSSFTVGVVTTSLVQSSSVTTSLGVPLVGAGVIKLGQIYPYTLGANVGTTVTALLAALANANTPRGAMGLAAAAAHLMFNIFGTAVFWPLKRIPMSLAQGYARVASRQRVWVVVFLLGFFFLLPLAVIVIAALTA